MTTAETTSRRFSLAARLRSFVYAGRGVQTMLVSQHNAWVHAVATVLVVGLGFAFRVSRLEWLALILAIVSVWTAEALNTAFEFLCDAASPEFHPLVQKAKDVAAGAVLICAVGAAVAGVLVLGPQLWAPPGLPQGPERSVHRRETSIADPWESSRIRCLGIVDSRSLAGP